MYDFRFFIAEALPHDEPQAPIPRLQYPPQPQLQPRPQATTDAASETTTVIPGKPTTANTGGFNRW